MVEQLILSILLVCTLFGQQTEKKSIAEQLDSAKEIYQFGDKLCGPNSLFIASFLLGVKTDRDELARLAGMTERGTTLYGLKKAAIEKGLYAVGIQTKVSELRHYNTPIIAHVGSNDHFLVVAGFEGDRVKIINPPQDPFTLSLEDFKRIWTGKALIISKKEIDVNVKAPRRIYFLLLMLLLAVSGIIGLWRVFTYKYQQ